MIVPLSKAYDSSSLAILARGVSQWKTPGSCNLKAWECRCRNSKFNERRKPFPATFRLLFRSTEQEIRGFMVVQVLTIQCIWNQAEVLAMYVLYLFQWSSDTQNLESQSDRLVEESDKGEDQSGYGGGCSNDCHCLRLCRSSVGFESEQSTLEIIEV